MEPPSKHRIEILNETTRRLPTSVIRRATLAALDARPCEPCEVSILFGSDERIQGLNREFRRVDEPTDVLSFPAGPRQRPGARRASLGDLAISVDYAERQARLRGVTLETELAYLAIHGTLHLLGMDDESEDEHEAMLYEMGLAGERAGLPPEPEWHSMLHHPPMQGGRS